MHDPSTSTLVGRVSSLSQSSVSLPGTLPLPPFHFYLSLPPRTVVSDRRPRSVPTSIGSGCENVKPSVVEEEKQLRSERTNTDPVEQLG